MTTKNGSNTAIKQPKGKRVIPGNVPFKKGKGADIDPRINTKGRPKSFDQLRALFQMIGEHALVLNGKTYTRSEAIGLAMSADKKLMRDFLEYAYGKVPQAVELGNTDGEGLKVIIEYANSKADPAKTASDGADDN
jgi:hypothetical protein